MSINPEVTHDILLDTHVWVWLCNGDKNLTGSPASKILEQAAAKGRLRLSVISIWEFGMLEAKGRITLSVNCQDWVKRAIEGTGISVVALTPEIAIESSRLPHEFHGDSADRMIVATARKYDAIVATRDKMILEYGKQNNVKVLAV